MKKMSMKMKGGKSGTMTHGKANGKGSLVASPSNVSKLGKK